jgi:hypothetical protein
MRNNLTISADPSLFAKAVGEHTTLNEVIRRFLADFAHVGWGDEFDAVMAALRDAVAEGASVEMKPTRDDALHRYQRLRLTIR